jgi:hypothetical protein
MLAPSQDKGRKQKVQVRQGKLNFTTLEEVPEGALIMTGIFSVYNQPALILFDSGASHSFISQKFSAKCELPFSHSKGSFMIVTPGGKISTNQLNQSVPIQLEATNNCPSDSEFSGISWLLPKIYSGFLSNCEAHN